MGASIELLLQVWLGAQNIYPIVLILSEAGRARTGQQDELREAMKVGHMAESLQHQNHGDQPQEEVGCRDSRGARVGLFPWAGLRGCRSPQRSPQTRPGVPQTLQGKAMSCPQSPSSHPTHL